jgi:N-acetylmuramoyl-L-alanine amidase
MAYKARRVHRVGGGVTIRDYRGSGLCPPNGGRIKVDGWVEHIPVIRNRKGVEDGISLGRVLRAQGFAVQTATDADGNVFIFTSLNLLCYHARGLNSHAGGTEHMHYATSEPWNELQCRAAAWIYVQNLRKHGVPLHGGRLASAGYHQARFTKRGHVSHKYESHVAGYNDRGDPGGAYPWEHIVRLALFYIKHGTFKGAPKR